MGSTRPVFSQKAANTTILEAVPVVFRGRFFFGEARVSLGPFFVNMSCSWFLCVMALNAKVCLSQDMYKVADFGTG